MATLIERCLALSRGVPESKELARILELPRRMLDLSTIPDLTPVFSRDGSMSLWPIQSAALLEIEAQRGGLFPIGVGHGKTLISLLAGEALNVERVVLLVPPSLKEKTIKEIPKLSEAFKFRVPYVVSYSELSSERGANRLEELKPDLIVADEAHRLKRKDSARTRRFLRYFRAHSETCFVALSGTFTNKSLRDYAHLAELALKEWSPVPRDWGTLEDWCAALDPDVPFPAKPGALLKLCEENHDHQSVRDRYRCRLVSSPGVVATSESSIGTSLIIRGRVPCGTNGASRGDRKKLGGREAQHDYCPESVARALRELRETWTRPDGEEISDALTFSRIARQVAQGFWLRWAWPQGQVDHEWLSARAAWHKEVRAYLSHSASPGRDTPLLLARAAEMGTWQAGSWPAWAEQRHKVPPPSEVVWLSTFLAEDAVEWLKGGGIVCVAHPVLGEKVAEIAKSRGVDTTFFGAGNEEVLTTTLPGIVMSTSGHREGKNLQDRYSRMLFTHVPGPELIEQSIGRCHRPGQEADEVEIEIYLHTSEVRERWEKTKNEARYIQETMGPQKILFATRIDA